MLKVCNGPSFAPHKEVCYNDTFHANDCPVCLIKKELLQTQLTTIENVNILEKEMRVYRELVEKLKGQNVSGST